MEGGGDTAKLPQARECGVLTAPRGWGAAGAISSFTSSGFRFLKEQRSDKQRLTCPESSDRGSQMEFCFAEDVQEPELPDPVDLSPDV